MGSETEIKFFFVCVLVNTDDSKRIGETTAKHWMRTTTGQEGYATDFHIQRIHKHDLSSKNKVCNKTLSNRKTISIRKQWAEKLPVTFSNPFLWSTDAFQNAKYSYEYLI